MYMLRSLAQAALVDQVIPPLLHERDVRHQKMPMCVDFQGAPDTSCRREYPAADQVSAGWQVLKGPDQEVAEYMAQVAGKR